MLELVVSMGPENTMMRLPNLLGLSLDDALEQIGRTGIDFEFSLRAAGSDDQPGTVVLQNPPGDTLASSGTRVSIVMVMPDKLQDNEVFGLFTYEMAKNPYPLLVNLESIRPGGTRVRLLSVQYPGGKLSVPYIQPVGSMLVLSMLNREIYRETVTLNAENLPMGRF
jgi:beta-lactam-binding protein with PASTA domain